MKNQDDVLPQDPNIVYPIVFFLVKKKIDEISTQDIQRTITIMIKVFKEFKEDTN